MALYQAPPDTTSVTPSAPPPTPPRKAKGHANNTCANSSLQKRMTRQLAGIMAHLERHPRDVLSQTRVSTIRNLLGS
jgi:hypothetical protein